MKNKIMIPTLMIASFTAGSYIPPQPSLSDTPKPQLTLPATVLSVHDGDTMRVKVEVETSVRLLDCWAKELKDGEKGLQSKENLLKLCPEGSKVLIQIPFNVDISKMFTFGRVLGLVYKDGVNLSEQQIKDGYGTIKKDKKL